MVNNKIYLIGGIFLTLTMFLVFAGTTFAEDLIYPETFDKSYDTTITVDMSNFIKEDFNPIYGVITLESSKEGKLAEYSLTKNTETCILNCEAEGKVTLYSEGIIFEDVKFKTLDGKDTTINNYSYYIFEGYQDNYVDVPDTYKEVCIDFEYDNKTEKVCHDAVDTYKKENQPIEIWAEYNFEELAAGDYRWKIKGVKDHKQSVDFIPIIKNIEFSEWAVWQSSFYVGLVSYYKLDESAGTNGEDSLGNFDGTFNNAPTWEAAKINNGATFGGTQLMNTGRVVPDAPFTLAFWYKEDAGAGGDNYIFGNFDDGKYDGFVIRNPNTNVLGIQVYDGGWTIISSGNQIIADGRWKLITLSFDGAQTWSSTVNGTVNTFGDSTGTMGSGSGVPMCMGGSLLAAPGYISAPIDEVGLWNRTLNSTEILDLYNDGAGLTYPVTVYLNITGKVLTPQGVNIANATIIILDSLGNLVANTTSNDSGDWKYQFENGTITNYTIVGYNTRNTSQGGNAYPFFNA